MSNTVRSLYFEEFNLGDKFYSSEKILSSVDIDEFARITGDKNPIHMDEDFAKTSIYGRRIGHGLLGLSLVSGMAAQLGFAEKTTMAFRSINWKFKRPIGIGDTIKGTFEVVEKRELPIDGGGLVAFQVTVSNQEGQVVQIGKWSLVIQCQ